MIKSIEHPTKEVFGSVTLQVLHKIAELVEPARTSPLIEQEKGKRKVSLEDASLFPPTSRKKRKKAHLAKGISRAAAIDKAPLSAFGHAILYAKTSIPE